MDQSFDVLTKHQRIRDEWYREAAERDQKIIKENIAKSEAALARRITRP